MSFDSQLKFISHINERVKKAQITKIQIKRLTSMYDLVSGLVWQINLFVLQLTAFYGAEWWWKSPKNLEHIIQQIIVIS